MSESTPDHVKYPDRHTMGGPVYGGILPAYFIPENGSIQLSYDPPEGVEYAPITEVDYLRYLNDFNNDNDDGWFEIIRDGGGTPVRAVYNSSVNYEDSNSKQTWETGAQRDTQDEKSRPDLIDPTFLLRIGEWLRKGAEHYGEHNWAKGIPASRCMASLQRHVLQYASGDRSEDHLSAIVFNAMAIARVEGTELDDLFDWN